MLSVPQKFLLLRKKQTGYNPFALPSTTYLDATVGSSITIGTGVSQWTSLSGSANYTEASGTAQPAYNLTGLDGRPAVVFDGINDKLTGTFATGGTLAEQGFTLVFIVKTAGTGFLFGANGGAIYLWTGNGSTFEVGIGGVVSGKNIAGGWLNNNKTKIIHWRYNGTHAGSQIFVNGVLKTTTNGASTNNPGFFSSMAAFLFSRTATSGWLAGAISFFNSRPFYMSQDQINEQVVSLLKEKIPTALTTSNGLPIVDANQDLTY